MKRIMITVVDMTIPSRPGREYTMTMSTDGPDPLTTAESLTYWTNGKIMDILTTEDDEASNDNPHEDDL